MFTFSKRSLDKMIGVHPDLQRVMRRAITQSSVDFAIMEGLRTKERQAQLYAAGASQTLKSRHITGHAVDVAAFIGKDIRWDWPLYVTIAKHVKAAAMKLNIPIVWGGDWRTFKDGPHFELDRRMYP